MHHARNAAVLCVLFLSAHLSALAQLDAGPGFDSTPVEIPTIQKAEHRPVTSTDLLRLRDIHGIRIAPDGQYAAFVLGQAIYETNSYRSGLFVVSTKMRSTPIGLGTAGPPQWDELNQWVTEDPQWSADSRYIYRRLNSAGVWQVWKWNREGGAPVQVTHAEHDVTRFQINSEGTMLVMFVRQAADEHQLAERGILYDGSLDTVTPEPIVGRLAKLRAQQVEPWIHDLQSGREHKASEQELENAKTANDPDGTIYSKVFTKGEVVEHHASGFEISPDGEKIIYIRSINDFSESEWLSSPLLVKSVNGGSPVVIAVWDEAGQYWWSPDSKEIYYTQYGWGDANDEHPSKLMVVSAAGRNSREIFESAGILSQYSADRSGLHLACVRENSTSPPEVAYVDLRSGEVRTLVNVNPEFDNLELSPSKRLDISNKYGDHFWGHLVLPVGAKSGAPYPLVITTYRDSGGFLRGAVGDEYPIQVLAANGFAVWNCEALGRLRNPKPDDFNRKILFWESPIDGIEKAVSKLKDMGLVDPSRIGITGLSHGADIVDYAISHTDLFYAAIDSGGGSRDPLTFYLVSDRDRAAMSDLWDLELPEGDSLANWKRVSSSLNARRIRTPLLINAADAEYAANMQLVTTLRELKKPVEMFIYANEEHLKNQPKHRYEIYERNVDWIKFWLKGEEDPDPAKAEQYLRWRELRKLQEQNQSNAPTK
jgi:dipeptidyl aminopeptidase/acylaminoacyl peptidase